MRRVVSLYLPSWPSDHWRRAQGDGAPPAETPVVITGRVGARKVVVDADRAARTLSAHPGLALAPAQARVPGLVVLDHQPAEDEAALERIALWALRRYSPLVAVDGRDGLWTDASGVAHLFGGEVELLQDLLGRLRRAGAHASAAIADTREGRRLGVGALRGGESGRVREGAGWSRPRRPAGRGAALAGRGRRGPE